MAKKPLNFAQAVSANKKLASAQEALARAAATPHIHSTLPQILDDLEAAGIESFKPYEDRFEVIIGEVRACNLPDVLLGFMDLGSMQRIILEEIVRKNRRAGFDELQQVLIRHVADLSIATLEAVGPELKGCLVPNARKAA